MNKQFYTLKPDLVDMYLTSQDAVYYVAELEHTIPATSVNGEVKMLTNPLGGNKFWHTSDLLSIPEYIGIVEDDQVCSILKLVTSVATVGVKYKEIGMLESAESSDAKTLDVSTSTFGNDEVLIPFYGLLQRPGITVVSMLDLLTHFVIKDGIIIENAVDYMTMCTYVNN